MRKLVLLVLGVVLLAGQLLAQTRQVSGRVTDATGNPVPNASVTIKGTNTGTTTNADGTYTLTVPANSRLVISAVGLAVQDVAVSGRTDFNFTLSQEDRSMQEVVVVGYGTARRKDITGNIASVKGNAIKNLPVQSFDQALSGQMAGVSVTMPNGVLNNPPVIRVRGSEFHQP